MAPYISAELGVLLCDTCQQLLEDWADAERSLGDAESVLMAAQTADPEEFLKCCLVTWKARRELDDARLVLEQHRRTHSAASCWPVEIEVSGPVFRS